MFLIVIFYDLKYTITTIQLSLIVFSIYFYLLGYQKSIINNLPIFLHYQHMMYFISTTELIYNFAFRHSIYIILLNIDNED